MPQIDRGHPQGRDDLVSFDAFWHLRPRPTGGPAVLPGEADHPKVLAKHYSDAGIDPFGPRLISRGMQRLFSMFPAGWPGVALLLLRVALGINLVHGVLEVLADLQTVWIPVLLVTVAIAVGIGCFTPVNAVLSALIEIAIWHSSPGSIAALHLCAILVAAAIAMLGPGAYSLDAKLFGRRRVIFPTHDGTDEE
jgi:hypothetical protein